VVVKVDLFDKKREKLMFKKFLFIKFSPGPCLLFLLFLLFFLFPDVFPGTSYALSEFSNTDQQLLKLRILRETGLEISDHSIVNGAADPEFVDVIRNWVTRTVVFTRDSRIELINSMGQPFWAATAMDLLHRFESMNGGVMCGGAANFLGKVLDTFSVDWCLLDTSSMDGRTHCVTLVKVLDDGIIKWAIQDPTYGISIVRSVTCSDTDFSEKSSGAMGNESAECNGPVENCNLKRTALSYEVFLDFLKRGLWNRISLRKSYDETRKILVGPNSENSGSTLSARRIIRDKISILEQSDSSEDPSLAAEWYLNFFRKPISFSGPCAELVRKRAENALFVDNDSAVDSDKAMETADK
jgi:hypothetical protein